jgi:hypothetical protein
VPGPKFLASRNIIAGVAAYYKQSPLEVEKWKSAEILDWHNEAVAIENEKAKAMKNTSE